MPVDIEIVSSHQKTAKIILPTTLKFRLINPAKNELGRISKVILDKINLAIREHFSFNQWKNTQNVIDWFNEIPDKKVHKFVVFDIKEFYPSIKEQ